MRRFTPIAAACCSLAAAVSIASADDGGAQHQQQTRAEVLAPPSVGAEDNGLGTCKERYLNEWYDTGQKLGWEAVGSNRVDDGNLGSPEACEEANRLAAMRQPPPPEPAEEAPVEDTTSYSAPAPAASSGGCPASMAAEASSPDAVNPTSGASGCYQVLPSTAAAMGAACADVNAPSCVAAICASQGNGAWSASGATPCG